MSKISKIVSGVGVSLVLLGVSGTPAEANAIYAVNLAVANPVFGHVTGELITDGTLGVLEYANLVDWNLTIESSLGTDDLLGPKSGANSFLVLAGDALTATPDGLYFDLGVTGLLWVTDTGLLHAGSFLCLERGIGICNVNPGLTIGSKSVEGFIYSTGNVKIATLTAIIDDEPDDDEPPVDVPEPASVVLLAAGALAVLRRRGR